MRSIGSSRSFRRVARLLTATALAYAVSGCTGASFSKLGRTLPDRDAIVMDPMRGNPKVDDRDLGLIAQDWRAVALENERRLDISGCNYLDLQASYAAGKPTRTDAPECIELRKSQEKKP